MKELDWELENKVAIVTGSSHGIGLGIARLLVNLGCNVVINGRNDNLVKAVVGEMGERVIGVIGDIRDIAVREELINKPVEKWGRLDFLVNNVGIGWEEDLDKISPGDFENVFKTNLVAPFELTKRAFKEIAKQGGGSVLFITSVHDQEPGVSIPYSTSKAAIRMLIEELALKLAPQNIRVNGIAPGAIQNTDDLSNSESNVPLGGRRGTIEDIGYAAAFLLSPNLSAYTTGTILRIDGGLSLVNWIQKKS